MVTGEERGLLGSDYFARNPSTKGKVVANLNLDLLFWEPGTKKVVFYGEEHSSLGPLARTLATAAGFDVIPDPFPEQGFFTRSDHYSFVVQGIPAIYLSTGFDNDGAAAKAYIEANYHKPSDQLGKVSVDYRVGAKLLVLAADVVAEIGNVAKTPTWSKGSFFGDLYGNK